VTVNPDLGSEKHLGKPGTCEDMIGDHRDRKPTLSLCQRGERNNLIRGEAVQRRAGFQLIQKLARDIFPDRFSPSSQCARLIRPKPSSSHTIAEGGKGCPRLEGSAVVADCNV